MMNPLILPLLLLGAGVAFAISGNAEPKPEPSPEPSPQPEGAPTGPAPEPTEPDPTRPRSGRYRAFLAAYAATPFRNVIGEIELNAGLPENFLARLLYQESGFDPEAVGRTPPDRGGPEVGIAQFLPGTADELGIDPMVPEQAIEGAARYINGLKGTTGSLEDALIAYNWGIGNVQRLGAQAAPAGTRNYARDILADSELQ